MKEEKEAFIESLYLRYAGKLERASLNYVRHRGEYRDLVDDSIQKTFLKAYEEYDALKVTSRRDLSDIHCNSLTSESLENVLRKPKIYQVPRSNGQIVWYSV